MARQQTFDVEGLATAGLELAGRDGWSAVSFRAVARELGVSPMALYRVVPDAEGLRRVIADSAAAAMLPRPGTGSFVDSLRSWAVDAYRQLGDHHGLAAFVLLEWTELPGWLDIVEALLADADERGLDGPLAVAIVNAVFAYVLARAQLRDRAATAPRRKLVPLARQPRRYPHLRQNRAEFATAQTDKHFVFGLDALINGLRVGVARAAPAAG